MIRAIATTVTLLVAVATVSAGRALDAGIARSLETTVRSGDIVEQRKDVDEVSRPQPPNGPATPVPFCSPGSPICP